MRADGALAERRFEVREAAAGWRRAGAIDEATHATIVAAYPDDRARLGPVFRVLVFLFTVVAMSGFLGLFEMAIVTSARRAGWIVLLLSAAALVALTEFQIGVLRRRQGGTESATAFLGLCCLVGGFVWFTERAKLGVDIALAVGVLALALAAHRWGYALFAGAAAVGVCVLLARTPFGRILWIVAAVAIAPRVVTLADSGRLAPALRRCCDAIVVVSLVCLYLAVDLGSWDTGLVERVRDHADGGSRAGALRPLLVAGTALVPVAALVWGIATRRRLLINLGLVGVLASLVTLRVYVHVAPLWVALLCGGSVAISLALAIRRHLDAGPGRERGGFTAEPVFGDPNKRGALEVAASVASLSPTARPPGRPGFEGEGGQFGGGGASTKF
jgi:hypothetical protein